MVTTDVEQSGTREDGVGLRWVLGVLCLTQITSWGVLFYAFPVLAPTIAADTGWSMPTVIVGFSLAQIISAVVGIPVGRVLDRRGPRVVMTAGSVLAVGAVVLLATNTSYPGFLIAWLLIGTAMAGVLYQPAFAALTRWYAERRVSALTALTLVAGLASTVFAPLSALLNEHVGWRKTYLVLAVALGLITIPAHALGLRRRWPTHLATTKDVSHPERIARSPAFVTLVVALSLGAFAVYAVVVALVPLLTERGLSTTTAAWALGLGGVGQVLGRLGYSKLVARTSVRTRTTVILTIAAATTVLLGLLPGPAVLLIGAAVLAGSARGVFTLLQATAVSDRWGAAHYGRLGGLLSAPVAVVTALSPWVATALAGALGGYSAVFLVLAAIAVLAAVVSLGSVPRRAH
ncbi:MFS transporter [Umezawaea endophytica]|uniref:MFS transporter n=1 Tax=Umezawaea endophytica TaxID=1654476 RepID=A0A9X2VX50_9PSEU|nr:MFS transporter [Umezawaea endophytica]MCS7484581.1 MFS transporter [Umezawaea endophytica]